MGPFSFSVEGQVFRKTFRFGPFFGLVCRGDSWEKASENKKTIRAASLALLGRMSANACHGEAVTQPTPGQAGNSLSVGCTPECTKIARFSAVAAAILTAPPQNRAIFEAPRGAISSAKKIASEQRFSLRLKGTNLIPTAEFPAIPESAAKIASERRCAILVHSGAHQGGHATARFLEGFLEGSLTVSVS